MYRCSASGIRLEGVGMHAHTVSARLSLESTSVGTPSQRWDILGHGVGVSGMGLIRIKPRLGAVSLPIITPKRTLGTD